MLELISFTKKQYLCVGKPGEEPIIAVLRHLSQDHNWDLNKDKIELMTSDQADIYNINIGNFEDDDEEPKKDDTRDKYQDLGEVFDWQMRIKKWDDYDVYKP